jgi:hypothetical protein
MSCPYQCIKQLVVGVILAQNPTGKYDQPIMCSCRLLNYVKRNYTTTNREALTMVYVKLHKFGHYLLSNNFLLNMLITWL